MFATDAGQRTNERLDEVSGLLGGSGAGVFAKYQAEGLLDASRSAWLAPLSIPGILLAGRESQVIGAGNIQSAATAWHVPLHWFEKSGHFPYVEEPPEFARVVGDFFVTKQR